MIKKLVETEFGGFLAKYNHGYLVTNSYKCILAYKSPENESEWSYCPCCGLKPKIWTFNNGRSTACGCGHDEYNHFSVCAESIMSVHERTNGSELNQYNSDSLRRNWNEYCATFINPCSHADLIELGRW